MPSEATNEATRREWRELGFFYDRDENTRTWRLIGAVEGLRKFSRLLREYVSKPRNEKISECDHFGPYMYLEIGTWHHAEVTDHWIAGPLDDLTRLAGLVDGFLDTAKPKGEIDLSNEFAPGSPFRLILEVRDDTFDPAVADPNCW